MQWKGILHGIRPTDRHPKRSSERHRISARCYEKSKGVHGLGLGIPEEVHGYCHSVINALLRVYASELWDMSRHSLALKVDIMCGGRFFSLAVDSVSLRTLHSS